MDLDCIVQDNSSRFVLFPIRYANLWDRYKLAQRSFWTPEDIDLSGDLADWTLALTSEERHLLSIILAFFVSSDGIVGKNLVQHFYCEIIAPEARCFYGFQLMMGNIHAETYSRIIQEVVVDEDQLRQLFDAINTFPAVRNKATWCLKWFDVTAHSFATRLLAFAIVECIFFSSSFAAIYWIKTKGILHGLCRSNELIMRDEGQHVEFACELYSLLVDKLSPTVVYAMVQEAVILECNFFDTALPCPLSGLNVDLMRQYVQYVADLLLQRLGVGLLYGESNPFPFMEFTAIPDQARLFECAISDYHGSTLAFTSLCRDQ